MRHFSCNCSRAQSAQVGHLKLGPKANSFKQQMNHSSQEASFKCHILLEALWIFPQTLALPFCMYPYSLLSFSLIIMTSICLWAGLFFTGLCLDFPLLLWMAAERHPSRRCSGHTAGARRLWASRAWTQRWGARRCVGVFPKVYPKESYCNHRKNINNKLSDLNNHQQRIHLEQGAPKTG